MSAILGGLPYVPMREQWLLESPLFLSGDARLMRAGVLMLMTAWRSTPMGTLSPAMSYLAGLTGLTENEFGENYGLLTTGWELRDERLCHIEMSRLAARLLVRHGEFLEEVAENAAAALQDPEHFELTAGQPESSRNKGKRILRDAWRPSPETLKSLAARGITTTEDVGYIVEKMRLWAKGKAEKRADWDATLLGFADNEPRANFPSSRVSIVPGARGSRFGGLTSAAGLSRGEQAVAHNAALVREVLGDSHHAGVNGRGAA